jgi:hypothetical protein
MGNSPLKRLNRLRKAGSKDSLEDYFRVNLTQNWKAIEDTFSDADRRLRNQASEIASILSSLTGLSGLAAISSGSGLYSTTSSTFTAPTNLTITKTTSRPNILIGVLPGDSTGTANLGVVGGSGEMRFTVDSTQQVLITNATASVERAAAWGLITGVSAGSHNFTFQVRTTGAGTFFVYGYRMFLFELPI